MSDTTRDAAYSNTSRNFAELEWQFEEALRTVLGEHDIKLAWTGSWTGFDGAMNRKYIARLQNREVELRTIFAQENIVALCAGKPNSNVLYSDQLVIAPEDMQTQIRTASTMRGDFGHPGAATTWKSSIRPEVIARKSNQSLLDIIQARLG